MKNFASLNLLLVALLTAAVTPVSATILDGTISTNWTGTQAIPDNNASGVAFSFNLFAPGPVVITNVTVGLTITGTWDGDLYAYLSHGSGFSVLLNRIGRTAGNPDGFSTPGLTVELSDSYLTDIHTAGGNPLTGNFAPDGRNNANPFNTLDTDPRNAPLGSFNGLDPNGTWTLFFADLSPASVSAVRSWTVSVGTTVPEPASGALLGVAALLGLARRFLKKC